jgi:hypothetical protein
MQCFQNALAYFVMAVSYACKMFMKSTPGVSVIKTFYSLSLEGFLGYHKMHLPAISKVTVIFVDKAES